MNIWEVNVKTVDTTNASLHLSSTTLTLPLKKQTGIKSDCGSGVRLRQNLTNVSFCALIVTEKGTICQCSSGVEQDTCNIQVGRSNRLTGSRGISSVGRAPALQAGCQEFKSPILHGVSTPPPTSTNPSCGCSSTVEHLPSKQNVESSNLFIRLRLKWSQQWDIAQLAVRGAVNS